MRGAECPPGGAQRRNGEITATLVGNRDHCGIPARDGAFVDSVGGGDDADVDLLRRGGAPTRRSPSPEGTEQPSPEQGRVRFDGNSVPPAAASMRADLAVLLAPENVPPHSRTARFQ